MYCGDYSGDLALSAMRLAEHTYAEKLLGLGRDLIVYRDNSRDDASAVVPTSNA